MLLKQYDSKITSTFLLLFLRYSFHIIKLGAEVQTFNFGFKIHEETTHEDFFSFYLLEADSHYQN